MLAGDYHRFHAAGFAKRAQESRIRAACAAQQVPFGKNDRPGKKGEAEQKPYHDAFQRVHVLGHVHKIQLQEEGNRGCERQHISYFQIYHIDAGAPAKDFT